METPTPTGQAGSHPPPPPPFGSPRPRQLRRRPDQGHIAGVCAGISEYFNVDPIIVRIAAVVLLVSGPGLVAYVLAWIFVPAAEGAGAVPAGPPAEGRDRAMQVFGIVLLVIAVSVLWGHWWGSGREWMFPIGLIALGAWLLLRPDRDDGVSGVQPAPATGLTVESGQDPTVPSPTETITEGMTPADASGHDVTAVDATRDLTAPWEVSYAAEASSADGGDGDAGNPARPFQWGGPPPMPPASEESLTVRRRRRMLAPIVMGALLVWAGLAWVLGISVETGLAVGLCIVGLGFVLGAFVGGSWTLIVPAVVIGAALIPAAVLDLPLNGPVGDRTWTPQRVEDLDDRYELSIGEGTLDLTQLDLGSGETVAITGSVGIGHLVVQVPAGMTVDIEADVSAGELALFGVVNSGVGVSDERLDPGDGSAGTVELDLEAGIGQIEVRRAQAGLFDGEPPSNSEPSVPR